MIVRRAGRLSFRTHNSGRGTMSNVHDILQTYVGNGSVPGAVGLMARGDRVEVAAAGSADVGGTSRWPGIRSSASLRSPSPSRPQR
jgi:hypothetical protein